eukprot:TRINITY_DN7846_c0_g1_i1.p4 TRINITY_DN7846_c0_g1~~TRINITY_DN7846_c0_g1_i1.p4  ORF type:complete len:122 (-),score=13.06 TRINITY_DN7846_c0_g1_i1:129-494(-)
MQSGNVIGSIGSQIEMFTTLQSIGDLLEFYTIKQMNKAVGIIRQIGFIPLEMYRVQLCADLVNGLPTALQDRLGMLLTIVGEVLLDQGLKEELKIISRFASQISTKLPQTVLAKIAVFAAG